MIAEAAAICLVLLVARPSSSQEWWKPYSPPCTERENVFAFTQKPKVKRVGKDKYEITFAVKGYCDVTVGIVDAKGKVVRHLGSGVLGRNAPPPFQKSSLKQTIYWNGKGDLDHYHQRPAALRVQVRLGLKPVFHGRLGGASGKNAPGYVWGIAVDQTGAYVFMKGSQRGSQAGFNHVTLRKYDLDGNYVCTVFPPSANMPQTKLAGGGFVEYEKGKRAWHGHRVNASVSGCGFVFPSADGKGVGECQVATAGSRLVYVNSGDGPFSPTGKSSMHWVHKDGSTDFNGMRGTPFAWGQHFLPRLASSPDGKWIYMVSSEGAGDGFRTFDPLVVRAPADGSSRGTVFAGERKKPGSDNDHLNKPSGIDCDARGRVYVSDLLNNRIQVFAPDGRHLKSIKIDRPRLIRVHQKTGAIYVQHGLSADTRAIAREAARRGRRPTGRLTKLTSFENPKEEFHVAGIASAVTALDSWSERPRLWVGGGAITTVTRGATINTGPSVMVYEEQGETLKKIVDFDEEARQEAGDNYMGRWGGMCFDKVVCDPTREQLYYKNRHIFDVKTGKRLGTWRPSPYAAFDDIAFDKRGFMHLHFNPGANHPKGVGRVDPSRRVKDPQAKTKNAFLFPEVPYDHGVPVTGRWGAEWQGIIPAKDQPGAKSFQDGLGVNMRGDVAINSNIYYVPKMTEAGWTFGAAGILARKGKGEYSDAVFGNYANYMKGIRDKQKRGEEVYFIRRQPGIPLAGATAWTFDSTGELRKGCAAIAGDLMNGMQMDEDGSIYFVTARPRLYGHKHFLFGRGGTFGRPEHKANSWPFTGTLIKSKPNTQVRIIQRKSVIAMDPLPKRPAQLMTIGFPNNQHSRKALQCWVEGAEWLYAGASPIVSTGCSCFRQHLGLDWYKRVYVPEAYRHSIGILDTNGNLVMHLGRYGNFDDAPGGKNGAKPGGEDIRMMMVRFVSATDNYLAYGDWDEKLVVLKLDYHAEETAPLDASMKGRDE